MFATLATPSARSSGLPLLFVVIWRCSLREAREVASSGNRYDGRLMSVPSQSQVPRASVLNIDGESAEHPPAAADALLNAESPPSPEAVSAPSLSESPVLEQAVEGSPVFDEAMIQEFVEAVLSPDEAAATSFVHGLRASGTSVESIYLDLLAPTARRLGDLWSDDACGFAEVTMALGRLQLVLRDLSHMLVRDHADQDLLGRVLLACPPGEQHSLGLFMVAEFFIRDGWGVRVGPPLSESDLLADVRATWYDAVGFSVSCASRLDHLKREIRRVREASLNPRVLIMVGGTTFNDHPDLVSRVGADASAINAELAPERARQLLALS